MRLPQAARLVSHKLYSSTDRHGFPEKAAKDRHQALMLAAVLAEADPRGLSLAFKATPGAMARKIRPLHSRLSKELNAHSALRKVLRECLKP